MKLLIIDDHSIVREGVAALLGRPGSGIEVVQACDATEGLAVIDDHADLDAVLLDLYLPGRDGISALRDIAERRPDLPVVLTTGYAGPALQGAYDDGIDVLAKPYELKALEAALSIARSRRK